MLTIAGLLVLLVVAAAAEIIAAIADVASIAFTLFVVVPFRLAQFVIRRRAIPAPQRNLTRAGGGAFVLALLAAASRQVDVDPSHAPVLWVIAAVAATYLLVGYRGSRGVAFDLMAVFWWSFGAACCVALLLFAQNAAPLQHDLAQPLACAGLAACLLRAWLLLRPVATARLPHPSKIAGLPMAGPASMRAAHAALGRRAGTARPKFRT